MEIFKEQVSVMHIEILTVEILQVIDSDWGENKKVHDLLDGQLLFSTVVGRNFGH